VTRALRAWLPPLLWATLIFVLSSRPSLGQSPFGGADKLAHLALYGVLGLLLARTGSLTGTSTLVLLAGGLVYAASDEVHQAWVPGRTPDVMDWIADAAGLVAGFYLPRVLGRRASMSERR
jgi:VanZ family protein